MQLSRETHGLRAAEAARDCLQRALGHHDQGFAWKP